MPKEARKVRIHRSNLTVSVVQSKAHYKKQDFSPHSQKRAIWNKPACWHLATDLLQQVDMRSQGLPQLLEDMSVAICQQTCFKMIVKACWQQACCKWHVATSLILTDLLQLDEIDKFVATCGLLQKAGKICHKKIPRTHSVLVLNMTY